jgi:hypothetical protein
MTIAHPCPPKARRRGTRLNFLWLLSFFQEKESNSRQTRQAFTPVLFQAKLPPALALRRTMGTRPIRTHTPAPALLPRAQDKPSPLVDFGIHCANPSRIVQRPRPHMPGLTKPRGNSPVLKAFARAHLRLPGSPKNCPNAQPSRLRNIWCHLPVFKSRR